MAPQTQKALVVASERAPWELRTDWPVPIPGPKEVLVKIVATALNPADWKVQTFGNIPFISYPYLGGLDGAGIIEEVGSEVTNVKKDDKVLCPGSFVATGATFQEYHIAAAENVAKIPENLTFDQAASVPLALATAVCSLWTHHPEASTVDIPAPWEEGGTTRYAGKPAFIVGGSSSVGQFAIQAARLNCFSPIITTSSLRHEAYLKSLGATHVLDRALSDEAILAEISKIAGTSPVAFAFESIGAPATERLAYTALGKGGAYISVMPRPGPDSPIADLQKEDDGKRVARPFASFQLPGNHALGLEVYKRVTGWLADGTLLPNRVDVLPNGLAGIVDGLKRMAENQVSGVKLIVHPQETP